METLRRVARVHRRWLRTWGTRVLWVVALAAIGAAGWLAARPDLAPVVSVGVVEREIVREVPSATQRGSLLSISVESPRAAGGTAPAPCPPSDLTTRGAAGVPYKAAVAAPHRGIAFRGVVPSPNRAGWLAAHTAERVFLSRDDGRTFGHVLDHPGALRGVAFGCGGELYALRKTAAGIELGVHGASGDRWRSLKLGRCHVDVDAEHALYAGGGWLVVVIDHHGCEADHGLRTLWLSPDRGQSWRNVEVPESPVVERLALLEVSETLVRFAAYEGDCMYDGTVIHDVDPVAGRVVRSRAATRDFQLHDLAVRGGAIYGRRDCDGSLCRARLGGRPQSDDDDSPAWTSVQPPLPDDDEVEPRLLSGPRHLYSLDSRGLWRLSGTRARLAGHPGDFGFTAVDVAGRLVGVTPEGRLLRWSRRHGTRALPTVDNPPPAR